MIWRALSVFALVLALSRSLSAQCPDGSPPPCQTIPTARRVLIDTNALVVLPFRVNGVTAEPWLQEGLSDLVSIGLEGLDLWRVIPTRLVVRAAPNTRDVSDPLIAAQVGRSIGAGRIVVGRAFPAGPRLRLHAELYDTRRSIRLASAEVLVDPNDPSPAVNNLVLELARTRLSALPLLTRRPLEDYMTQSPRALRLFLIGEQLARRGELQAAADSLAQAIRIDSTFGLAYYRLWAAMAPDWSVRADWDPPTIVRLGLRYRDHLPSRSRELLITVAALHNQDPDAMERADSLRRHYPDDPDAAFVHADVFFHIGRILGASPQEAIEILERLVEREPRMLEAYHHLIVLRCRTGDTTRAWELLDRALKQAPHVRPLKALSLAMRIGLRREDPAVVLGSLRGTGADPEPITVSNHVYLILAPEPARWLMPLDSLLTLQAQLGRPRSERVSAMLDLVFLRVGQGRHGAAWDLLQEVQRIEPESDPWRVAVLSFALTTGRHREEAVSIASAVLAKSDADADQLWIAATLAAMTGDTASQSSATGQIVSVLPVPIPSGAQVDFARLRGLAALSRGDSTSALAFLRSTRRVSSPQMQWDLGVQASLALARLELALGRPEAAAGTIYGATMWDQMASFEELRARAAIERHDTTTAVRAYQNVVALWKDADPEVQPRLEAARAALARLGRD